MRIAYFSLLAVMLIILSGCSKPAINASSEDSMKKSIEKMRESLPESKRAEFDEALQVLAFSKVELKDLVAEGTAGIGSVGDKVRQTLDGKTAEQIIAEAGRIQAERKERERQQALDEIRELEQKRIKAESAISQLMKFKVLRSRFYKRRQEYSSPQPIIELTVQNGTDQAVSRAYFEGTLASPGRSVPWHKAVFNHSISGGLEPGEKATWHLIPNMFSDWGTVNAPPDAVFTVTVERLDGPDGELLFSTDEFTDSDRERLAELKKKYLAD